MARFRLHSKKTYWVIGAVLVIALLVGAADWFNYYRIADFEMRWMTASKQVSVREMRISIKRAILR